MFLEFFVIDIRNLDDPKEKRELLNGVPKNRKEKTLRYKYQDDRKRSLGAWILIKTVFEKFGFSIEKIYLTDKGKPESKEVFFNISHSGFKVFLTLSEYPVGCDVEEVGESYEEIVNRVFSPVEINDINTLDSQNRQEKFYQYWTSKESYLKMTGQGLIDNMNKITIDLKNNQVFEDNSIQQGVFVFSKVLDNYCYSVCLNLKPNN